MQVLRRERARERGRERESRQTKNCTLKAFMLKCELLLTSDFLGRLFLSILGCNPYPVPAWKDVRTVTTTEGIHSIFVSVPLPLVSHTFCLQYVNWGISANTSQLGYLASFLLLRLHANAGSAKLPRVAKLWQVNDTRCSVTALPTNSSDNTAKSPR